MEQLLHVNVIAYNYIYTEKVIEETLPTTPVVRQLTLK
jgi:hypothetical protein